MSRTSRRGIASLAILIAVAWPLVVIGASGEMVRVEWADVVGEGAVCCLSLVWLFGVLRSGLPRYALVPISTGLLALFIGQVPDVLDEFFVGAGWFIAWTENLSKVVGVSLVTLGAWRWHRYADQEVESLEASSARFETLSVTDPMTGLFNRAHLADSMTQHLAQVEANKPLSLLMLDIDDFKLHNDEYGHPEGDKVILTLAEVIRQSIRETDVAFRYGGEEFAVLLPGADLERARIAAERIRLAFAHRIFSPQPGSEIHKTVSLGVARAQDGDTPDSLVERADEALYRAKRAGKDRVVAAA